MTLARKVDRLVPKREKKMLVAELHVSTSSIGGDVSHPRAQQQVAKRRHRGQ